MVGLTETTLKGTGNLIRFCSYALAVCTQVSTQIPQHPSKVLSETRPFAPTGAQTKHGNARTESPNIWLPEPPAVPHCAALSSGRQLCWRPLGRSTQSPGERTSQSETALR